jgi:hypothetical protein
MEISSEPGILCLVAFRGSALPRYPLAECERDPATRLSVAVAHSWDVMMHDFELNRFHVYFFLIEGLA